MVPPPEIGEIQLFLSKIRVNRTYYDSWSKVKTIKTISNANFDWFNPHLSYSCDMSFASYQSVKLPYLIVATFISL